MLEELRSKHEVPSEFPEAAATEAEAAEAGVPRLDLRDIPFVTLDPADSRDLDQAFHIEHTSTGMVLRYAIADLPGFVAPGGAIDLEARRRGQTLYLPDGRVPLHPPVLSEGKASLLPDKDRTAFVWTIPVDQAGAAAIGGAAVPDARVERARIRSRAKLNYVSAQQSIDAGTPHEQIELLREFGLLRIEQEARRGGASLNMADEEIVRDEHGYRIVRSFPLAVEEWNAQLSLLTGMVAARIMLDGGIGILRTMPSPDDEALSEFRSRVAALGKPWPSDVSYGEYLRSVPRDGEHSVAVLHAAASLFRGADYAVFGVPGEDGALIAPPASPNQAAIAAPYAHVTAPLRRLVDRWTLVICEALCAGAETPDWVTQSLADIPSLMRSSSSLAGRLNSAIIDRVEAALLRDRVGEVFSATVLQARESSARVLVEDPPVTANAEFAGVVAGQLISVRVTRADVLTGEIELEAV
ncbi:RNB domain-containing ribonuclease [Leucobacter denitrificans]|uniref:RNB domain-containing ribonuclease n=1 Tax=Leucobacter denitrificans TaxID=683042 RepID=UPI001FEA2389|nr:RNB domain-containing ribonuclease [Leucobacter denitrificans]